jgi:hypothetical protein
MEAWQISNYFRPRFVPTHVQLSDDGQAIVLQVNSRQYEIEFDGIDGRKVLNCVLSMADPEANIWSGISFGTVPAWQTSLVQQLDSLSLIRGEPAYDNAIKLQTETFSRTCEEISNKLLKATTCCVETYAPIILEFLQLIDCDSPKIDEFSIDDIGSNSMRRNFAAQTFFLQKLYVEENFPLVIHLWKYVLQYFAYRSGFGSRPKKLQLDLNSCGLYCPAHVEAYLLCLLDLVLLAPTVAARRRFVSEDITSEIDTGINFMQRAEQFALSGLTKLGEPRYMKQINESPEFCPLVQGLFIEQYHVTQRFVEIIAPLMTKRLRSPLKRRVYKYFQEELGHEVFERETCEALGVPMAALDAALPLPLFQAYVDAFTVFGRYDPIGYISSIMVTEGMVGTENPLHDRLEELVSTRANYQQIVKRHDDLNIELNHAALSRLFFCELSEISPAAQRRALANLAFLLELNIRAMDQASDFYGAQSTLTMCSLSTYPAV